MAQVTAVLQMIRIGRLVSFGLLVLVAGNCRKSAGCCFHLAPVAMLKRCFKYLMLC